MYVMIRMKFSNCTLVFLIQCMLIRKQAGLLYHITL